MSSMVCITRRVAVVVAMASLMLVAIYSTRAQTPATTPTAAATTEPASVEAAGKKVVTPSGLAIISVQDGTDAVVQKDDLVVVDYTGKLTDGKVFDSSREPGHHPIQVHVGAKEVIAGWDEGLVGMKFMEKRQLIIPAKLGYGEKEQPGIPANSTLVFDVQIIGIARLPVPGK